LLSVEQTAVFHLSFFDIVTKQTLIRYLKSSECKAKPRRTHQLTFLFVSGRFCVCFTQICTGRIWV